MFLGSGLKVSLRRPVGVGHGVWPHLRRMLTPFNLSFAAVHVSCLHECSPEVLLLVPPATHAASLG